MKRIESLEVFGKRWFQRSFGNTYHTVEITVNGEKLKSEIRYGYGNHYLTTAYELLRKEGYEIPEDNLKAYAMMLDFPHDCIDVKRMRDL